MRKLTVIGICLVIAVLITGGSSVEASKENNNEITEIKHLFQPIDSEAHKYLLDERSSEELNTFTKYLIKKYDERLDIIVNKLEKTAGKSLQRDDKEKIKYLLIREYLSRIDQEQKFKNTDVHKEVVKLIPVGVYRENSKCYKIYYAQWSSSVPYPIYYWIQVIPDVYGGKGTDDAGNGYDVNGGNELYQVSAEYTTNYVKYTLDFKDEDHPNPIWDAIYDIWRQIYYGRIEDIESFTVQDGIINFDDIWDNDKTYAEWWGQHGDKTRPYSASTVVYVSNVWNHAMDTLDKNPSMSKIWWYTSWFSLY